MDFVFVCWVVVLGGLFAFCAVGAITDIRVARKQRAWRQAIAASEARRAAFVETARFEGGDDVDDLDADLDADVFDDFDEERAMAVPSAVPHGSVKV